MNSIEITINNLNEEKNIMIDIMIDIINNKIKINNQIHNITKEQIDDLLRIIRTWSPVYKNKNDLDSESFLIKITDDSRTEIIKGQGDYPDNYQLFKEWISEFYE